MRTTARDHTRAWPSPAARVMALAITGYRRFVSPAIPPHCRFVPSCSAYALEAVQRHGALRGGWLAVRRLSRCHPFHRGGIDPVPDRAGRAARDGRDRPAAGPAAPMTSQGASR